MVGILIVYAISSKLIATTETFLDTTGLFVNNLVVKHEFIKNIKPKLKQWHVL